MSDEHPADRAAPVDLTNCDREPIHIIGHVQSFGCLVAINPDWTVIHASENLPQFFGVEAVDAVGGPVTDLIGERGLHDIRSRLQLLSGPDGVERLFGAELGVLQSDERHDVAVYRSGRTIVIEIEASTRETDRDTGGLVRPMIQRLEAADGVERLCQKASRHIKALTGFDRVMVYRFAPDDSGEVIAETKDEAMEPFLGLHYPASDIPAQARDLYRRNLLRIISDVDDTVSPIVPARSPGGEPLDLSMSGIRAVSPIHLEYLSNMGVRASMSISIIVRGKLWGLIACHHNSPRVLGYDVRTAAELYGQMFAFILDQAETDRVREETERARQLHDRLMSQLADGASMSKDFDVVADGLGSVIAFDGIAGCFDGTVVTRGETPDEDQLRPLFRFLNTATAGQIYATDHLPGAFPPAEAYAESAPGVLALPVSRTPQDYIVLFRREVARAMSWAGEPAKAVTTGPLGDRLTPRKSFQLWKEVVRHHSMPWTEGEIRAAEALRVTLLEVVLRMGETAIRASERAQERQELLIAELNHRVRNILSLMRGLMTQSKARVSSIDQLTDVLDGRIQALARAHDQITRKNWAPASLVSLMETELGAYFGDKSDRALISGEDVLLEPTAFTTLSLVVHELATNAAKYGALSDSTGRILIDLTPLDGGGLSIAWREEGGPTVQPPTSRGFGSTIIERSVPYELKGTADIRYEPDGLVAEFRIPAAHVRPQDAPTTPRSLLNVVANPNPSGTAMIEGNVLVVEDNMIIALDAEMIFSALGAQNVYTAASVAEAERLLDSREIDMAMLDVNLGSETSEPIAERLHAAGKPFIFATGYGEATEITEKYRDAPVLQKPYDDDAVKQALLAL